ncbi:uncharacterized protein [Phaseolus vulgaris]|uniref:uncharacterized protein n=1 Tax=Phaseolus vulgaris TaxID=3885 RepID=UPI0035C958FC
MSIVVANFKFKIISKILTDRLVLMAARIISPNQYGFVQGRQIQDCIGIASEAINMFSEKVRGVLRPLPVKWDVPSPGWVKINIDATARGYPGLVTCGCIFRGSMGKFIGIFSALLEVEVAMVAEFYEVIHAVEEAQKMGRTNENQV